MLGEIQMERDESEAGVATGEIYNNANRIFLLQFKTIWRVYFFLSLSVSNGDRVQNFLKIVANL